ncbi:hypothetical protein [Ferrimonas pelagia]|uniref:Phage shock protein B n=1 Tax=Ferrimonas pelagia TaxID=1177826 RepID=A0ABP9EKA3_9GAMM
MDVMQMVMFFGVLPGVLLFSGVMAWMNNQHQVRMAELKGGNRAMQQQMKELVEQNQKLAERVAVLEKLAVDDGAEISREIRKLA